jgi:hypothetical protein
LATKSHMGGWILHCKAAEAEQVVELIKKIEGGTL